MVENCFIVSEYHPLDRVILPNNRWRPSLLPTVAWNPWTDVRERDDITALNISFPFGSMPDDMTRKIIQSYDASVSYIDDLLGQLLNQTDDNTIVVFTSDHGWSLSQHGEFSKYSNFDQATRVPLILFVPGLSITNVKIDSPVELVDLFPTLVDLTQISNSLELCNRNKSNIKLCTEGRSLVPLMYDSTKGVIQELPRAVFSQYPRPGLFPTLQPNSDEPRLKQIQIMGYSIRTDRYRYTEWVKFNNMNFIPNWDEQVAVELYDHLLDPEENDNLADVSGLEFIKKQLSKKLRLGWRYAS